eukprot:TRINITY_DN65031_c0_g1_i1.p1 TRINITY_DN65031_c0_g1~~TRINITY_DN65031_c0_g1_i1.p1  ORF type:complete len:774 (+),score=152.62 TRINITY_DN65031_c0_g1_i1:92-2323(+)
MPALLWCGRKWNCGSDDLVVPELWLALLSAGCVIAALVAFPGLELPESCADREERQALQRWLIAQAATAIAVFLLSAATAAVSVQGTPFKADPRRCAAPLLTAQYGCFTLCCGTSAWGTHLLLVEDYCGDVAHWRALEALLGSGWATVGAALWSLCCCWDHTSSFSGAGQSQEQLKRYEDMWTRRCRSLCRLRCCPPRAADASPDVEYGDVGVVLASVFQGLDLVPSDISSGLILLAAQQRQMRAAKAAAQSPKGSAYSVGLRWPPIAPEVVAAVADFERFSNHALAAYGWMMQMLMRPVRSCCRLASAMGRACSVPALGGNCCGRLMSSAALVAEGVGTVVTYSNANDIHMPVWYLAVDHDRAAVVVAIRGTMSASDVYTDGTCTPVPFGDPGLEGRAHKGFLASATHVYERLSGGDTVLAEAAKWPSYRVVVLGHSMGAGVAVLLAMLLRPKFPGNNFRCLAYAVPGGLLSHRLAETTRSYIWALCVGKDLVPRLGLRSLEKFREELLAAIAATKRSKCSIMSCCCRSDHRFYFGCGAEAPGAHGDVSAVMQSYASSPHVKHRPELRIRMYPPAQLLYLSKEGTVPSGCCGARAVWYPRFINTAELQDIISSPFMVLDHLPDREQAILKAALHDMADEQVLGRQVALGAVPAPPTSPQQAATPTQQQAVDGALGRCTDSHQPEQGRQEPEARRSPCGATSADAGANGSMSAGGLHAPVSSGLCNPIQPSGVAAAPGVPPET